MQFLGWLLMASIPLGVFSEEEVVAEESVIAEEAVLAEGAATTEEAVSADEEADPPHPVDERIREQLDALELNYEIDDNNNFSLVFNFDDGRSQHVMIRSKTWSSHDLEMRDIWSTAYRHRTKYLPEYLERRLLIESYDLVIGAWARRANDVLYLAKLPADAAAESLLAALYDVSEVADVLEEELVGTDEL